LNKLNSLLALAAVGSLLTACSQGNSAPPAVTSVNPGSPSYSKLSLAVGTANIAGVATGLNVVSTLRQPNGDSAVLLDTPSLTGPWTLPAAVPDAGDGVDAYATIQDGGPSLQDFASNSLTGTSPSVHLGSPACDTTGAVAGFTTCPAGVTPTTTTFGMSGGVFGMGIQPANSTTNTTAYSYDPYAEPIFNNATTSADAFVPWGGPPAFDDPKDKDGMGTRDGLHNLGAGLLGWNTGMTVVQATPGVGTYTMNVAIPTGQNQSGQSSYATVTATGGLRTATLLPTITAPTLVEDGAGGGTLSVTLPAGATEGYVTITDIGPGSGGANCQGSLGTGAFPVYYTILIKPGTTTYTLPDTIGPNTTQNGPSALKPSMTICTAAANTTALGAASPGDTYSIQYFAMDYPLYEASYPYSSTQTPALLGAAGQADVTISAPGASAVYSMHRNAPSGTVQARIRKFAKGIRA
jgi:hypothetical protein